MTAIDYVVVREGKNVKGRFLELVFRTVGRSPMVFLDRRHYCDDTGLYPALLRQAERLGFADLLSVADEPDEILDRFPAQATPLDASETPRRVLMRMRNLR